MPSSRSVNTPPRKRNGKSMMKRSSFLLEYLPTVISFSEEWTCPTIHVGFLIPIYQRYTTMIVCIFRHYFVETNKWWPWSIDEKYSENSLKNKKKKFIALEYFSSCLLLDQRKAMQTNKKNTNVLAALFIFSEMFQTVIIKDSDLIESLAMIISEQRIRSCLLRLTQIYH